MARARNIKPGFFKNEILLEMSAFDRLLFVGLWCLADREGRLEDRPKRIKLELFPCDTYDVDAGLNELARNGFIKRYQACGKSVVALVNFLKHQTPHGTEKDSDLPDEDGNYTIEKREKGGYAIGKKRPNNVKSQKDNVTDEFNVKLVQFSSAITVDPPLDNALNPDSLNPDSLNQIPPLPPAGGVVAVKDKPPEPIPELPEFVDRELWDAWVQCRKGKRISALSAKIAIGQLSDWNSAGLDANSALRNAVIGGWQGLFKPDKVQKKEVQSQSENSRPQWAIDAGFANVWEANNARCYQRNAHEFRNGEKVRGLVL